MNNDQKAEACVKAFAPLANIRRFDPPYDFTMEECTHGDYVRFIDYETMRVRHEIAMKLVLLFHSASPRDEQKQMDWRVGMAILLPGSDRSDATTKNLCDAVRAALAQ